MKPKHVQYARREQQRSAHDGSVSFTFLWHVRKEIIRIAIIGFARNNIEGDTTLLPYPLLGFIDLGMLLQVWKSLILSSISLNL